jgi:hypothetical protein
MKEDITSMRTGKHWTYMYIMDSMTTHVFFSRLYSFSLSSVFCSHIIIDSTQSQDMTKYLFFFSDNIILFFFVFTVEIIMCTSQD